MKLDRLVPCSKIEVRSPRWKQRVVGIASYRVKEHNEIEIIAVGKDGRRYYPDVMYASGETIRACETQTLPQGVMLYLVPISKLEILERV